MKKYLIGVFQIKLKEKVLIENIIEIIKKKDC